MIEKWQKGLVLDEGARAAQAQAEETARRTRELLTMRGWCLWRCNILGDTIAVVIDENVEGVPGGYPVYTVTQLEGCIEFWQSKLDHERYLMDVSTQTMVEATIKYLKLLMMGEPSVIRQNFLRLPIEERRQILKEQASDPEIQAYYRQLTKEVNDDTNKSSHNRAKSGC